MTGRPQPGREFFEDVLLVIVVVKLSCFRGRTSRQPLAGGSSIESRRKVCFMWCDACLAGYATLCGGAPGQKGNCVAIIFV